LTCGTFSVLRDLRRDDDIMITSVCFSHNGKYLATGSSDGVIYVSVFSKHCRGSPVDLILQIWEIDTKYVRNAFKGHTHWIGSLRFSPNGRLLVSASDDNTARLWNMRDGAAMFLIEDKLEPTFLNNPYYTSAAFSPDGRYVAASHRDGIVRIWNARTGQLMRKLKVHINPVDDIAFMPDGKGLVSGGSDMTLMYWDVSSLDTAQFCASSTTNYLHKRLSGVEEQTRPEREFSGCYEVC
jgi:glucose repression regulatory protein TUP1